jgi:Protein of unknown function (DUF1761)
MEPNIQLNMLAIAIAVAANFVLGFIWYTPLFGKVWGKEMGFDANNKPPTSAMVKGMVFMVIGNFLMAWVFAHNMAVWNPVTWGLAPSAGTPAAYATMAAIFTWLGFYFPGDLGSVAWENKSWKLFFINTGYHLASLFVVAMILAHM